MRCVAIRWTRLNALLAALAVLPNPVSAADAPPPILRMEDGPGGATCDDYDASMRLSWVRKGGDWVDANGTLHGAKPFSTAQVMGISNGPVELDLTALLKRAADKGGFHGVLISGVGGSEIVLATRENKNPALHPRLVLKTVDGREQRLSPRADTYLNCTSNKSLGAQEAMRAGAGQYAVLDFDLGGVALKNVQQATLELYPLNIYGRSALLSAFALDGPVLQPAPAPESGLAAQLGEARLADNPAVLFTETFEEAGWIKRWSIFGEQSKAEAVTSGPGFAPLQGKALKVTVPAGGKLGLDLRYRFREKLGKEPEEAYLRYYVRFPSEWKTPVDGGKLPGLSGTYGRAGWGGRTPDGYNGWNARMLFRRQAPEGHSMHDKVGVGTELSVPEVPGVQREGHFTWAGGHAGVLDKNRWYCIEQYVKMNTVGQADGIVRGWVDGRLAFERTGVIFRHTDKLKIEEVWMNVYHGGGQPTPRDIPMYIDSVVAATRYIGPAR
ncbi:polysaccharide lyase [Azoarcus olearius]|uniref:Conserved hypothetical secreted protein n=1 Tax=Azoarcus sp. (strain BH72) TaxID=418699 RepID=A1KAM4_AZOSB|nr:hypothetical protein [Azoarcus olearius]CAL95880.1 conserved hypothetical secreted protein [Azoarcus olearius]